MTNTSKRKSGADLPSWEELLEILKHESPREAVHFDYLDKNKSIFSSYVKLATLAECDVSWIDNYPNMAFRVVADSIIETNRIIADYVLANDNVDLYKKAYLNLIPIENTSKSDAIFVFGAESNARIERAIELYNQGVAPKIIISGHRPFYANNQESEAYRMSKFAIENGIPESAIIVEDKSITIPDNVKRTIDLLEKMAWHPTSLTIITTNFVLRRACMDWYKFTPWGIDIKSVAAHPQSNRFTKEGWFRDPETTALVLNEYAKLIFESKIDLMRRNKEVVVTNLRSSLF